jgi:RNA polymerase sigma factor (sigma-70 family)
MNREEAFVKLIQEHQGLISKIVMIYTDSLQDRQDLYQEVVCQLWKGFDGFRGESKFSTWMYRVALNTAISQLKKRNRQPQTLTADAIPGIAADQGDPGLEERVRLLNAHIGELNVLEKGIILLYLEGKKYEEIAEITGLTATNIGTRLSRIKLKLTNSIQKEI